MLTRTQHLWFVGSVACFAILGSAIASFGQAKAEPKPTYFLNVGRIYSDGEKILSPQPSATGEVVQQEFTISIPYTENGVAKTRTETRTRTVPKPGKLELLPVVEGTYFQDLNGKTLDVKSFVDKVPQTGRQVIVITNPNMNEIPAEWKELLKDDVIIMRAPLRQ